MFIRVVKMSFQADKVEDFLANFQAHKEQIRNFPGCEHLELWRDKNNPQQFFTYSYWQSEADLENYRQSELFKEVWAFTKSLFQDKPGAWSVDQIEKLA